MLRSYAVVVVLFSSVVMGSEPAEIINLWPSTPPGPAREVGEEADTTTPDSNKVAGRRLIRLGNVSAPQVHVYLPPVGQRNGSSVVICPGGGFNILAWDLEGTEVAEWLNSIGVTAIVLKYRVPTRSIDPKWLLPTQDAQRTISLVRSKAKAWGLAKDRVGVLGFSAGGKTAVQAALATKRFYEAADEIDDQSCTPDAAMLIYAAYLSDKDNTQLPADVIVTKDAPPMFLVHAFDDPIPVQGALLMTMALKNANVPSEIHVYDTGGHGYGLRQVDSAPVTRWPKRCEVWMKRNGWVK